MYNSVYNLYNHCEHIHCPIMETKSHLDKCFIQSGDLLCVNTNYTTPIRFKNNALKTCLSLTKTR